MALRLVNSPNPVEQSLSFLEEGKLSLRVMARNKASSLSEQERKGGSKEDSGQKRMGRRTNREHTKDQATIDKSMGNQATMLQYNLQTPNKKEQGTYTRIAQGASPS